MTEKAYDPRTRLTAAMCLSGLAVILNKPAWLAGTVLTALLLAGMFNSSVHRVLWRFRYLLGVFIVMVFVQSIFTPEGRAVLAFGHMVILTDRGISLGLSIILRLAILMVTASILWSGGSRDIIQGLYQCRLPYELVFMVLVAVRFIPVLRQEVTDRYTALQLRGVDIRKLKIGQKFKVIYFLALPGIAGITEKARDLSITVAMRGFRAGPRRTSLRSLKFGWRDYILILFIFSAALTALYLYFR